MSGNVTDYVTYYVVCLLQYDGMEYVMSCFGICDVSVYYDEV